MVIFSLGAPDFPPFGRANTFRLAANIMQTPRPLARVAAGRTALLPYERAFTGKLSTAVMCRKRCSRLRFAFWAWEPLGPGPQSREFGPPRLPRPGTTPWTEESWDDCFLLAECRDRKHRGSPQMSRHDLQAGHQATAENLYTFENSGAQTATALSALATSSTRERIRHLAEIGVGSGWHCWEVGAGGGSIATWLCDRVGGSGRVLCDRHAGHAVARSAGT